MRPRLERLDLLICRVMTPARAIRRLLLGKRQWRTLSERERWAVRVLAWHLAWRSTRLLHKPVGVESESGHLTIFLTVGWVQRLLREIGAPRTGEKYAAEVIETLMRLGLIEDTGAVLKPNVSEQTRAIAARYKCNLPTAGGQHAQESIHHSRWWRVFRLPTLPRLHVNTLTRTAWFEHGRSARKGLASLSALVRRQDLIQPWKRQTRFAPGSVQWAYQHSGPP